jgi:hypothetical protein
MGSFNKGEHFIKGGRGSFCSETFLQWLQSFNEIAKVFLESINKHFGRLMSGPIGAALPPAGSPEPGITDNKWVG